MVDVVTSVQRFSVSLGAGDLSGTAPISSVGSDILSSIEHYHGQVSSITGDGSDSYCSVRLTNPTTATVTRATTGQATVVYGEITTYGSGILNSSVQRLTVSVVGNAVLTNTGSISTVDTTLAVAEHTGMTGTVNSGVEYNYLTSCYFSSLSGNNSAEITAERGAESSSTAEVVTYVTVYEFASGVADVQQISATISAGTSATSSAFTAVTLARSHLAWGGHHTTTSGDPACFMGGYLSSTTQMTVESEESMTGTLHAAVVQWASGYLDGVDRGTITLAQADTSNTFTFGAVTAARTSVNWCGWWTGGDEPDEAYPALTYTNTTTATATRGSTGSLSSDTLDLPVEVIEYAAAQPAGGGVAPTAVLSGPLGGPLSGVF